MKPTYCNTVINRISCEKASVWKWEFSIRNYSIRFCTPAEKYSMCPSKDAKCKKIAPIYYYKRTYVCHSSRSLTTFEICIRYWLLDNSVMPDVKGFCLITRIGNIWLSVLGPRRAKHFPLCFYQQNTFNMDQA
jgi:hypothetical protein